MRIRSIHIVHWRHFENISLNLDQASPLVCIVGANGTGKSHLLELIAACAYRLGFSPGVDSPRGDPFSEKHEFSFQVYLAPGVFESIDSGTIKTPGIENWDRTLTIKSKHPSTGQATSISAGGIGNANDAANVALAVTNALRHSMEVCFLSLDADRSYPKRNYNLNDVAQAYETDWANAEYTRGRSFKSTATLYEEWIKYLLGQENQAGASMMQGLRKARKLGGASPVFVDHFEEYAASVQKVLPHLIFTGVDSKKRTLLFDTTGLQLTFNQLSGGEREIAFLIGQIDRFGLKNGLFLIDEPELHLNSDLIRSWVAFLTSTISVGQIWLATHSLEAVESAGQQSTFILERDEESRKVNSVARLDARPVLTALSRAVGTPAFSISKLAFVFIEGAESLGERERFSKLAGTSSSVRFLESGSCNEVVRRLGSVKAVAAAAGQAIRVGGIVDRDFRSTTQMAELKGRGIFFLPVHEVENLFLAPNTLSQLLEQNGKARNAAAAIVQKAADARAGGWIFQYAMATDNAKDFPEIASVAKGRAKAKCWSTLTADTPLAVQQIVDASGFSPNFQSRLSDLLNIGIKTYERRRTEPDLWKVCEGKEVLNDIAHECGFADSSALELAAFALWEKRSDLVPEELLFLRQFVSAI